MDGAELTQYFSRRDPLTGELEAAARTPEPGNKNIFSITGTGGVGKTSVLRMSNVFCEEESIPVALVSAKDFNTPIEVLEMIGLALAQNNVELPEFNKLLGKYKAICKTIESAAAKERAQKIREGAEDLAKKTAHGILEYTLPGAIAKPLTDIANAGIDLVAAAISAPADVDLYKNAPAKLTEAFVADLTQAETEDRRIVLMLDAYERVGSGIDRWLCELLKRLPRNVLVVVAGRTGLGHREWVDWWPGWQFRVKYKQLPPMKDEDVRKVVKQYYQLITDGEEPDSVQVEKIVKWTHGNLLAATTAVDLWVQHGYTDFDDAIPNVLQIVVNSLLEGTPEDLQRVLKAAAIVRWFNKAVLRALLKVEEVDDQTFNKLIQWTFVRSVKRALALGYVIDDSIRSLLNEQIKIDDKALYVELHKRASSYFSQRGQDPDASLEERQKCLLECLYHQVQLGETGGLAFFRKALEQAFFQGRQFDFCRALINELNSYAVGETSRQWTQYYEGLMAVYLEADTDRPCKIMEDLNNKPNLARELKVNLLEYLAAIYWYYSLKEQNKTAQAESLYNQALTLRQKDPKDKEGQARVRIWLGILHQRTRGTGESDFNEALRLCQGLEEGWIQAWARQELSIAYRMQGRFRESEELIAKSVDTFANLGFKFDEAGARLNHGMLLMNTGKLAEAQKELTLSQSLFQECPSSRIMERAWPIVGFGEVALRRGKYDVADGHFTEVLTMGEKANDLFVKSLGLGGQAAAYVGLGRLDEAIAEADSCLELKGPMSDKFGLGWMLMIKGNALLQKGRTGDTKGLDCFQQALDCFQQGYEQMQQYGSCWGQCKLLLGACEVYLQQGNIDEFNQAVEKITGWAAKDEYGCYADDLARVCFLKGVLAFTRAISNSDTARAEALSGAAGNFCDALKYALDHNIFVLDVLLQEIDAMTRRLASNGGLIDLRSDLMSQLTQRWRTQSSKDGLVDVEKKGRADEDVDYTHQGTVLQTLTKLAKSGTPLAYRATGPS
jgi:tetratricopeptide (TPR) repeat protein